MQKEVQELEIIVRGERERRLLRNGGEQPRETRGSHWNQELATILGIGYEHAAFDFGNPKMTAQVR
jgi:hypothetical protein